MSLKILIADDHTIFREGIRSLLKKEHDFEVVAEASDGNEALLMARKHHPDVIIMDMKMPGMDGLESTRRITAEMDKVQILALSVESDRHFVVDVLEAGAAGYLLKDAVVSELVTAILTVAKGEQYFPPRILHMLSKEFLHRVPDETNTTYDKLSTKEIMILQRIADGKNAKEIAYELNISQKTVDNHRSVIMSKLNLYNIADLTKFAIREGLSTCE